MSSLPAADRMVQHVDEALERGDHPRSWPAALRADYESDKEDRVVSELRFLLMSGLLIAISTSLIDLVQSSALAVYGLQLRLSLVVPVILAGLILGKIGRVWPATLAMCMSQLLFALIVLHLSFRLPPVPGTQYLMSTAILLGLSNLLFPFRLGQLIAYNVVYLLSHLGLSALETGGNWQSHFDYAAISLGISLGTLAMSERVERLQSRNYLLRMRHQFAADQLLHTNGLLQELSNHDPLTGLANRRHFESAFLNNFTPGQGQSDQPIGLLLIDLDHFKRVNDTHGHQAGDECLRQAARAMEKVFEAHGGMLARFGGEEFIGVVPERSSGESFWVAEAARHALAALRIPFVCNGTPEILSLTASVGVAVAEAADYRGLSPLLGAADAALYQAKKGGRNQTIMVQQGQVERRKSA